MRFNLHSKVHPESFFLACHYWREDFGGVSLYGRSVHPPLLFDVQNATSITNNNYLFKRATSFVLLKVT
jgi:hypothetical protein